MISKPEYEVLMMLKASPEIKENQYYDVLNTLFHDKLISRLPGNQLFHYKYFITPLGQRALEEYEAAQRKSAIDNDTLDVAREANDIARKANSLSEESNEIAEKANRKSKRANWIAGFATLFALGSLIVAIIALCCR